MKQCPRCGKTYSDDQLNFCLEDGELLSNNVQDRSQRPYADDSPPTLVINDPRVTNPYDQPRPAAPVQQWQPQQPPAQFAAYSPTRLARGSDKTLPTIAMILGILSLPLICCYGGLWLGIPAAIMGFIGLRNIDKDGERYGGRGMAIAGLILGVVSFLGTIGFVFFAILAG
jgi:hypothetical protein